MTPNSRSTTRTHQKSPALEAVARGAVQRTVVLLVRTQLTPLRFCAHTFFAALRQLNALCRGTDSSGGD